MYITPSPPTSPPPPSSQLYSPSSSSHHSGFTSARGWFMALLVLFINSLLLTFVYHRLSTTQHTQHAQIAALTTAHTQFSARVTSMDRERRNFATTILKLQKDLKDNA